MLNNKIRVLVVDDSAYLRKVLSEMIHRSPLLKVVGTARNGREALEKVRELRPDVVLLDLFMDDLDGVGFLQAQMAENPVPVVICSIASASGEKALAAMEAGAIEFIQKPTALALEQVYEMADELVDKILTAAKIPPNKLAAVEPQPEAPPEMAPIDPRARKIDAIVIGVSTGGPNALRNLVPRLPGNFPVPVAVVLHMPIGYTGPLAQRLNELSQVEVVEAAEGTQMVPGRVILAKAGYHLKLSRSENGVEVRLDLLPTDLPHRPSVDVLFQSAARIYGERLLGVVLTGMGDDGTTGAAWIKAQGGKIFTEAESSSVVFGMPRSVLEAGLSDQTAPLDQLLQIILESLS